MMCHSSPSTWRHLGVLHLSQDSFHTHLCTLSWASWWVYFVAFLHSMAYPPSPSRIRVPVYFSLIASCNISLAFTVFVHHPMRSRSKSSLTYCHLPSPILCGAISLFCPLFLTCSRIICTPPAPARIPSYTQQFTKVGYWALR
jgi:hypothetical protein